MIDSFESTALRVTPLFRGKPGEIPVDNHFAPPVVSDSRRADTERAGGTRSVSDHPHPQRRRVPNGPWRDPREQVTNTQEPSAKTECLVGDRGLIAVPGKLESREMMLFGGRSGLRGRVRPTQRP